MQKVLPVISKKFLIVLIGVMLVASMIMFISPGKIYGASTLYVATSGNDTTGTGSSVAPYLTIQKALSVAVDGDIIKISPGDYNIIKNDVTVVSGQTGWYLAITQNNITLLGITAAGLEISSPSAVEANIYSTQITPNGSWSSQNLITVFGNNVTIRGLGIMNKIEPNKGIEVVGNNFRAEYCQFSPVPKSLFANADNYNGDDITLYGSGIYFNNSGATTTRTATITNNIFKNSGVTFDSFGNNWTININENVFDGNRIWKSGGVDYYYSSVGATTWANQPDFTGSSININRNKFINMVSNQVLVKIKDTMTGIFNATYNWWGNSNPNFASIISGKVINYDPWYTDSAMTILSNYVPPTPPSGGGTTTAGTAITVLGISELGITESGSITDFVTKRLYRSILLREPDPDGLAGWVDALTNGGLTGEEAARGFVYSDELSLYLTALDNTGYLNFLYSRVLGRTADLPGLNGWLSDMSGGMTRAEVLNYFLNSPEWSAICNAYGVTP